MYCDFYQLTERPFNVTPDPKFLYLNARYREALASLNYGITQRKGFITLIGEAGTGKTTLLKKLLEDLDPKTKSVFIFNTNVTFEEILEYILAEFDLPVHNGKKLYMLQRLNTFLLEELRGSGNVALLIDEAQDLEFSVLEDLRLLSNLETAKEKILQIVLSGQPELGQKLSNPVLRQLRQRIGINCRLLPLSRDEISEYIQFRLQAAECSDLKLFSREAEDQIYHFSRGIPRLVNVVCDNALVIGYALGKRRIGADIITEAAADLLSLDSHPRAEEPSRAPAVTDAAPSQAVGAERQRGRLAVIGVALVAIFVGILSVGRTMWSRVDNDLVAPVVGVPFEVIRPGSEPHGTGVGVSENPQNAPVVSAPGGVAVERYPAPVPAEPIEPQVADTLPSRNAVPREAMKGRELDAPARVNAPPERVARIDEAARADTRNLGPDARLPGANVAPPPPRAEHSIMARNAARTLPAAQVAADQPAVGDNPGLPPAVQPRLPSNQMAALGPSASVRGARPSARSAGEEPAAGEPTVDELAKGGARQLDGVEFGNQVVHIGDSISGIAMRKYGQASYTILDLLKLANPELQDVDIISVGQTIRLPELGEGYPILNDGAGHYTLLVLSTPQLKRATALQNILRGHSFTARVSNGSVGINKPLYRVVLSGFANREEAVTAGKQVQKLFREDVRLAQLGE